MKAYVVGAQLNCIAIQMSTHNICFHEENPKKKKEKTQKKKHRINTIR